jgi:hypothetical protein
MRAQSMMMVLLLLLVSSVQLETRIPLYVLNQVILLDEGVDPLNSPLLTTPDYAAIIVQNFRLQAAKEMAALEAAVKETVAASDNSRSSPSHKKITWLSPEVQIPILTALMIIFVGLVVVFVRKFNACKRLSGGSSLEGLEAGGQDEEGAEASQKVYTISQENPGFFYSREDVREANRCKEDAREANSACNKDVRVVQVLSSAVPSLELCQTSRSLYI